MKPSHAALADKDVEHRRDPEDTLSRSRLPDYPAVVEGGVERRRLCTMDFYDSGVMVPSQQTRVFKLAWALVEGDVLRCRTDTHAVGGREKGSRSSGSGSPG